MRDDAADDDPKIRKDLYDLWIDKGLVVFKDLSGLDTQIRLSEVFGEALPPGAEPTRGVPTKMTAIPSSTTAAETTKKRSFKAKP